MKISESVFHGNVRFKDISLNDCNHEFDHKETMEIKIKNDLITIIDCNKCWLSVFQNTRLYNQWKESEKSLSQYFNERLRKYKTKLFISNFHKDSDDYIFKNS